MRLKTDSVLTKAETRIAVGYTEGKIGKEIADEYGLSYNTVIRHTQRIYDKADIPRSTNSLVAWFISKNFDIDLRELRRGLGSIILLCILGIQAIESNDNSFIRANALRRVEARKTAKKRNKREEELTLIFE